MQNIEKNTPAGYLARIELTDTTVLNIFTKAGNYRGGKTYSQDKAFLVLSWTIELTIFDWKNDIKQNYTPQDGLITISADTPNIFYSPQDSEMIEWFANDVETHTYLRYHELKRQNL